MANYNVKVSSKEMVAAPLPMQEHWLPQSNLDLLLPPVNVHVFFCYKSNKGSQKSASFSTLVANLKASLSQTLVSFYPFAGRLVMNNSGEPELLCNNEGVEFSEAYADVGLEFLDFSQPDVSVEGRLVPSTTCETQTPALFCVQVTSFKCGGAVVGCTFNHGVADASSANMFFKAWSDISQRSFPLLTPTFRRSCLNPQRPYNHSPLIPYLYVKRSSVALDQTLHIPHPPPQPFASKIYYLKAQEVEKLQSHASEDGKSRSKLEAFCAYLWQLVAKCVVVNAKAGMNCKLGVVVDGRSRLQKTGLPANYFGNVLSIPFAESRAEDLTRSSHSRAADLIHECIGLAACEEHFRGLINWVELQRPEPALPKIYCTGGEDDGPSMVVSSGLRFPLCEVDLGWGEADFASFHFPLSGEAGYVMPLLSPAGDGSWIVYMHLAKRLLEDIESHPDFVLIPFRWGLVESR